MFGFNRKKQQTLLKYLFLRTAFLEYRLAQTEWVLRRTADEEEEKLIDEFQESWQNNVTRIHMALITDDHETMDIIFAEEERKRVNSGMTC